MSAKVDTSLGLGVGLGVGRSRARGRPGQVAPGSSIPIHLSVKNVEALKFRTLR